MELRHFTVTFENPPVSLVKCFIIIHNSYDTIAGVYWGWEASCFLLLQTKIQFLITIIFTSKNIQ